MDVTFLLTDLEGSTRLWDAHPHDMSAAVARHEAIVAEVVGRHGGTLVKSRGEGDSTFSVFAEPAPALAAAAALQDAIASEPWPEATPIRLRAAVHTGTAEQRDGDWYGSVVNRCARLRELAHGGQVLVSHAAASRAHGERQRERAPDEPAHGERHRERAPDEPAHAGQVLASRAAASHALDLLDLGTHRLRDLAIPERVYQLGRAAFAPLRGARTAAHNLPHRLTSFVGREADLESVADLLGRSSLVTLVGTGGAGKTRLALEAAERVVDRFTDGARFVDLGLVESGHAVEAAVARELGAREDAPLTDHVRDAHLLVVLDNCEHVVDACASLAVRLLAAAARVRILATSREPLRVPGEVVWRVLPLALPDDTAPSTENPCVRLFCERASAVRTGFAFEPAVARVCSRLDGLPLAIELAAARAGTMSVEEIDSRLDDRFRLLSRGPRATDERSRTMEASVEWSFRLLAPDERRVLERLAVLPGGAQLDAAEAVCGAEGIDVREVLAELVDRSLVVHGEPRFWLLETIRAFALRRLAEQPDAEQDARRRALAWACTLAAAAAPELHGPHQREWLDRLEVERDNLRAVLAWSRTNDPGAGLSLAAMLWRFWFVRGHWSEGREALEALLDEAPGAHPRTRADALTGAGGLAHSQGDVAAARSRLEQALKLYGEAGDERGAANAMADLARVAVNAGDAGAGLPLLDDAVARLRTLDDPAGLAAALNTSGYARQVRGETGAASVALEESLSLSRQLGNAPGAASTLYYLGTLASQSGDIASAEEHFREAASLARDEGVRMTLAHSLLGLAHAADAEGRRQDALDAVRECLEIAEELGERELVAVATAALDQLRL